MVDIQTVKQGDYVRIVNFNGIEDSIQTRERGYLHNIVKVHSIVYDDGDSIINVEYEGRSGNWGFKPENLDYGNKVNPQNIYDIIG